MKIPAIDISQMVFQRVRSENPSQIGFDQPMQDVFMHLDGQRTIGQISAASGLTLEQIRGALAGLLSLGWAVSVAQEDAYAPPRFYRYLRQRLALAVGPAADILMEDEIEEMGMTADRVLKRLTVELIERLGTNIDNPHRRNNYLDHMMAHMRKEGYLVARIKGALK